MNAPPPRSWFSSVRPFSYINTPQHAVFLVMGNYGLKGWNGYAFTCSQVNIVGSRRVNLLCSYLDDSWKINYRYSWACFINIKNVTFVNHNTGITHVGRSQIVGASSLWSNSCKDIMCNLLNLFTCEQVFWASKNLSSNSTVCHFTTV